MRQSENNSEEKQQNSIASANNQSFEIGNVPAQFMDNRPEAALQRELNYQMNSSTRTTLQRAKFPIVNAVRENSNKQPVQRVMVPVGFDGSDTQSVFAAPGNTLRTEGVMNCLAIVVWDTGGGGAVMRHYDTIHAYTVSEEDEISNGQELLFDAGAFAAVRAAMINQLNQNVDNPAGYQFAISAGAIWTDVDPSTARWKSRHNLLTAVIAGIGVEPSRGGATASFNTSTNELGG